MHRIATRNRAAISPIGSRTCLTSVFLLASPLPIYELIGSMMIRRMSSNSEIFFSSRSRSSARLKDRQLFPSSRRTAGMM